MPKPKTHFEQVPLEIVRKIVELQAQGNNYPADSRNQEVVVGVGPKKFEGYKP